MPLTTVWLNVSWLASLILAHILKHTVSEFADCSLLDIERKYIESPPSATINTIPLDDTLDIKGKHTESNSPLEGLVTFDIIYNKFVGDNITTAQTSNALGGLNALLYKTDEFGSIKNTERGLEVTENASLTTISIALMLAKQWGISH